MAQRSEIRAVFDEIVQETSELVRQSASGKRRVVRVSPEVAESLERVISRPAKASARKDALAELEATKPVSAPARPRKCERPDLSTARSLAELEAMLEQCTQCPLGNTRTKLVFGEGDPKAKLVFVGEAPGFDEDQQGRPFVGRAGKLLTDIIELGFKIPREEVYICNVLKCRPPQNRNPLPSEIEECEPYLIRQLEIIQPKVICALGTYAAQTLLKTKAPIGQLRGRWHFYHGIPLRATYHPAYLLRNPADKAKTWEDVKEILKVYHGKVTPTPQ